MKKGVKIAIILASVGVVGVAGYLIYKKFIKNDDLGGSKANESNNIITKVVDAVTPKKFNKTPFINKEQGNKFRAYINENYPKFAKKINLDITGDYNNSYIREAYHTCKVKDSKGDCNLTYGESYQMFGKKK